MKCPFKINSYNPECESRECAIWSEDKNVCSLKVIAKELTNIQLKIDKHEDVK